MNEQNQNPQSDALFEKLSEEKKKRRRKVLRTVTIVLVAVAVVLVGAVVLLRRNVDRRFANAAPDVLSYQVSTGTIHTVVAGSGVLAEVDQEEITAPAGVEVTDILVNAGDTVSQGELLATVDMSTVLTALSDVQDQMKQLDKQISDAKGDEVSSHITAGVSGRVKRIFAEEDMDVSVCMARNGALAVLSLDGYMAADVETDALQVGDKVSVTREDGAVIDGTVNAVTGGKATILVTDNGPRYDEAVTVATEDGTVLGTANLYIHKPLAVTGYAGTISGVPVQENTKVSSGTTVVRLKNTAFSASYDSSLRTRADLEEVLMDLLTIYRDGAILAPMDGRISSVDLDLDVENAFTTETQVLVLFPNARMSIDISIDETDILALKDGQEAQVVVSSVSDAEFPAVVTDISKTADTSSGVTRYSAEVTLDTAAGMLPGMTADVDIQIEGVENALIIPVDALHQTSATYFVYTTYDEQTKQYGGMREVTIGMQNDSQVEILSGLQEGDTVYYTKINQPMFTFSMGMGGGMAPAMSTGGGMSFAGPAGGMGTGRGDRGGR